MTEEREMTAFMTSVGAADGAFIMYKNKRSDGDATIEVSGRDQPDKKFMLSRNKETPCWDFKGERSPVYAEPPELVLKAIGNFINADNVDVFHTPDNITSVCQPIGEAYDQLFKESTERYNAKQKRNDCKVHGSYCKHLFGVKPCNTVRTAADKRKSFYENVVQIGKKEDSGFGTEDFQLVADCLKGTVDISEYKEQRQQADALAEQNAHFYSRKKLNADAPRISREDQLKRSLQKALIVINRYGLRDEYNHVKLITAQSRTVLE